MRLTESDCRERQVEETKTAARGLLERDEEFAEAVEPGEESFDDPASGRMAGLAVTWIVFLLTDTADVRLVPTRDHLRGGAATVIALVAAQAWGVAVGRCRSRDCLIVQGRLDEPFVVCVGARDGAGDRNPVGLGQQAAFGALLATVRGVGPRRPAPKGAFTICPSIAHQAMSSPRSSS